MTSLSDTPTVETPNAIPLVLSIKRRGRPTGVKNGVKKKTAKKPTVRINIDAIVANSEVKKLTTEVKRLKEELDLANDAFKGAEMHIESVEKKHKAALIVIGYLEGKVF
jgi:hypothetical protein